MTLTSGNTTDVEGRGALGRLSRREDVLEICYWFQGEGFGDRFTPGALQPFLNCSREQIIDALDGLAADGALLRDDASYSFSTEGKKKAGRLFHESFTEFQLGSHGECTAGCCDSENDCDQDQTQGHSQVATRATT